MNAITEVYKIVTWVSRFVSARSPVFNAMFEHEMEERKHVSGTCCDGRAVSVMAIVVTIKLETVQRNLDSDMY